VKFIKNPVVKNILSAAGVAIFGSILLNLTFMLDYGFQSLVIRLIKLFTPVNFEMATSWFPPTMHISFVVIIILISWAVFRSKLKMFYKATFLTVPIATTLVTFGIFLYQWPIVAYALSSLFVLGVLYYFYRTQKPWLYYYAVILVGLTLLIMNLLGLEI